jgi:hypothetical protein
MHFFHSLLVASSVSIFPIDKKRKKTITNAVKAGNLQSPGRRDITKAGCMAGCSLL